MQGPAQRQAYRLSPPSTGIGRAGQPRGVRAGQPHEHRRDLGGLEQPLDRLLGGERLGARQVVEAGRLVEDRGRASSPG